MNYLRKSAILIVAIFTLGCLSTSFANTIHEDNFPRLLKTCLSTYGRTINPTQLFFNVKAFLQDIPKECISDQASKTKKITSTWMDLEDEDNVSLLSDCQEEKDSSFKQATINLKAIIAVPQLPPLFLLNSSFRL
jgi:hypothetical protein